MKRWAGGVLVAACAAAIWWGTSVGSSADDAVEIAHLIEAREHRHVTPPPVLLAEAAPPSAASEAGATRLALPTGASIEWTRLRMDANFGQLLDASLAGSEKDRTAMLWVSATCRTLRPPISEEEMAYYESDPERQLTLRRTMLGARERLASFCATGDATAFLDLVRKRQVSTDPLFHKVVAAVNRRDRVGADEWVTLALSSPEQNALTVDRWLDRDGLLVLSREISYVSRKYARELLYAGLTGVGEGDAESSFRAAYRCTVHGDCEYESRLSQAEIRDARAEAARVEALIRQQRWRELYAPPGR